jgi:hypothetical protein
MSAQANDIHVTDVSREETKALELPDRVVERVEDRLPRTEWDHPEEYVTYVVEEVLHRVERETDDDGFESVNEDEVHDRLKSLGYLDE